MAARTKSKVTPKYKTRDRVTNGSTYEAALGNRGDHAVWFDEDAIDAWNAPKGSRPGGQRRYSDLAIVCALTLRTVFHLPLRQTEGFVCGLIRRMGPDLETPDHTTLSRRSATVEVPDFVGQQDRRIHLAIDSTGLKIMGDGIFSNRPWHPHKHKTSNKRRSWRKLHLAVDGEPAEEILEQRDAAIARIAEIGRRQWRKEAGAHQPARAENGMYRYRYIGLADGLDRRRRAPVEDA
ncbi:MAG: hypothetical protein ACI9MR_002129 [Myxococcota bacterium]|jgi:hypothetical protein